MSVYDRFKDLKILKGTAPNIKRNLHQILHIDKQIAKHSEKWDDSHFLLHLISKNLFSFLIFDSELKKELECSCKLAGFIIASRKHNHYCHIHRIGVSKEYQRSGAGSFMIDHLFNICNDDGVVTITAKCSVFNFDGIHFFKKNKFQEWTRTDNILFRRSV